MADKAFPVHAAPIVGAANMWRAGIASADPIIVCGLVNFHKTTGNGGFCFGSIDEAENFISFTFAEEAKFESADEAVCRPVHAGFLEYAMLLP
jgi:hypothetical protein